MAINIPIVDTGVNNRYFLSLDPFAGIHAAVTRRRADGSPGPEGWRPEERITVEEAVRAYAMGAACASSEEREKGSIAPGKMANMARNGDDRYRSARGFPPVAVVFQIIYFAGSNAVRNGGKCSREHRPPPQLNFPADILAL